MIEFIVTEVEDPFEAMLDDDKGTQVTVGPDRVVIGNETIKYPVPVTLETSITQTGYTVTVRPTPYYNQALSSTPAVTQPASLKIIHAYADLGAKLQEALVFFGAALWNLYELLETQDSEQSSLEHGLFDLLGAAVLATTVFVEIVEAPAMWEFHDRVSHVGTIFNASDTHLPFLSWITDFVGGGANAFIRAVGRTNPNGDPTSNCATTDIRDFGITANILSGASKSNDTDGDDKKANTRRWYIKTNEGTPLWQYNMMILLIDHGSGYQVGSTPGVPNTGPAYLTELDEFLGTVKMKIVEKFPYVSWVYLYPNQREYEELVKASGPVTGPTRYFTGWNITNTRVWGGNQSIIGNRSFNIVPDQMACSFNHKRLTSMKSSDQSSLHNQSLYFRHESGGEGMTVFILDSGFDLRNVVVSTKS
jgi:hypothetical protein